MEREELLKLEEMIWRFKLEGQPKCSEEEQKALVTTLILIIKEIEKTKNIKNK